MWKRLWPLWLLALVMAIGGARVFRSFMTPPPAGNVIMETDKRDFPTMAAAQIPAQVPASPASVTPEMKSRLETMMRRDSRGLEVVEHAGGRRSVHLGGRFQHVTALVPTASGETAARCFSSYQELTEAGETTTSAHASAPATDR